ncbi:spike base protein, RCAP_Rcc01079 family [Methylobacterium oxalidis]|uniref:spike base protein, RCAP_Rcc01079 family n=1 Tax=Methylobacterium oxalidis TaxID=944322 RepID=UPI00331500D8
MQDDFGSYAPGLHDPIANAAEITPSDTNDLDVVPRALLIGTAGDLKIQMLGGQTVTLKVQATLYPIRVRRILATGTTASNIVACW